jgi:Protein of unknown function (DUF2786)
MGAPVKVENWLSAGGEMVPAGAEAASTAECEATGCPDSLKERGRDVGKNNRVRRAAKAKARQKSRRGTPRGRNEPGAVDGTAFFRFAEDGSAARGPTLQERTAQAWFEALTAMEDASHRVPGLVRRLAALPASVSDAHAQRVLLDLIGQLWSRGWQPAEVRRHVRITLNRSAAALVEVAIHADHAQRAGQSLDPRWADQMASLGGRHHSVRGLWLAQWRADEGLDRAPGDHVVLELCHVTGRLPNIDTLIPPPGAPPSVVTVGAPARGAARNPMLDRVRKLLAKAEATNFEEEASALTSKAQELMTRYAIDEALVERPEAGDVPRMMRVPIDAPYADAKSLLLGVVAGANRCRAVYLHGFHMSTLLGHADDLGVVELLFTSLLVQAQKAMAEAGRGQPGGRTRSASFRSSFLVAYASRIGERLEGANTDAFSDDHGASALPVLRAREDAVQEMLNERYGDTLVSGPVRGGYDPLGLTQGRQAADAARLDSGQLAG